MQFHALELGALYFTLHTIVTHGNRCHMCCPLYEGLHVYFHVLHEKWPQCGLRVILRSPLFLLCDINLVFNPSSFPGSIKFSLHYSLIGFGYITTTFRPEDKNEIQSRKCVKHLLKHESTNVTSFQVTHTISLLKYANRVSKQSHP